MKVSERTVVILGILLVVLIIVSTVVGFYLTKSINVVLIIATVGLIFWAFWHKLAKKYME